MCSSTDTMSAADSMCHQHKQLCVLGSESNRLHLRNVDTPTFRRSEAATRSEHSCSYLLLFHQTPLLTFPYTLKTHKDFIFICWVFSFLRQRLVFLDFGKQPRQRFHLTFNCHHTVNEQVAPLYPVATV